MANISATLWNCNMLLKWEASEFEAKEKISRRLSQKVILATVSSHAGLMSLALLAPNAIEALSKLGIIKKPRKSVLIVQLND